MKNTMMALTTFCLSLIFLNTAISQQESTPKMVLKEEVYNFNDVDEGVVIQHTFKVFNEGDKILEVQKIEPG
jgi:hypothetical protein